MDRSELQAKIKHISLLVKRLMHTSLLGEYLSGFKGTGLEFSQLREYIPGDEPRSIDWLSSAKVNKLMVKQFVQERERVVFIALDTSLSARYSSEQALKWEYMQNMAAVLATIAQQGNDKVSLTLFDGSVTGYVQPRRGSTHVAHIMDTVFAAQPTGTESSLDALLHHVARLNKRNAILFVVSDWISQEECDARLLSLVGNLYDTIAVRVLDKLERELPDIGLLMVQDPETGEEALIDTRSIGVNNALQQRLSEQYNSFKERMIDVLDITVGDSLVDTMTHFFHRRVR